MKIIKTIKKAEKKSELEMGIEVEKEHKPVYDLLKEKYNIDWSMEEFAEKIAQDHLNEFSNYYSALKKMETELKNENN